MPRLCANRLWKSMLAEYEPPPLDPGKDEAIRAFIDERKGVDAGCDLLILASLHHALNSLRVLE